MKRVAVVVVTAGCSALFGIDKIPYEGGDGGLPIMLTVAVYGSGSGTITDDTGMISCESGGGGNCTDMLEAGATVKLTAAAQPNSAFSGWAQACIDQVGTCTLPDASGSVYVVAEFSPFIPNENSVTLVPTFNNHLGSGAYVTANANQCDDDGNGCTYYFDPAITTVTLTGFSSQCAHFQSFAGGQCSEAPEICTIMFSGSPPQSATVDYDFGSGSGCN
jgi:hypothetical protein